MKLYYGTGACSLSPHIALREAGLDFSLKLVNLKTHQLENGQDFRAINPKGYVPALELDDGTLLTEGPAIVQYIADLKPEAQLAPANGTMARYRLQEWLTYIGTELHKRLGALFKPATEEQKAAIVEAAGKHFELLSATLQKQPWLLGEQFSVADAYLFTVLNWAPWIGLDLTPWPALTDFVARVRVRPAVQAALKAEGLK